MLLVTSISSSARAQTSAPVSARVPGGTAVQLMVTKEVDSRTAKAGDRFKLRVNAPVLVDGIIAIPVGATAWGEVMMVSGTGAAGGKGSLSMKLLYIDLPGGQVPLVGSQGTEGKANTAGLVVGVLSFGLLGLLNKGGNAHFKAGDIIEGYVAAARPEAAAADHGIVLVELKRAPHVVVSGHIYRLRPLKVCCHRIYIR